MCAVSMHLFFALQFADSAAQTLEADQLGGAAIHKASMCTSHFMLSPSPSPDVIELSSDIEILDDKPILMKQHNSHN